MSISPYPYIDEAPKPEHAHALALVIGGTRGVTDDQRALAALAYGRAAGCEALALRMVLAARREWRDELARNARRWATSVSRRPARGCHYDSWSLREKYVRCHQRQTEYPPEYAQHTADVTRRERERRTGKPAGCTWSRFAETGCVPTRCPDAVFSGVWTCPAQKRDA